MVALADPQLLGRWFGRSQSPCPPGDSKQGAGLIVTGTVKWFSDEKDYGFIIRADGGADVSGTAQRARRPEGAKMRFRTGTEVLAAIQGTCGAARKWLSRRSPERVNPPGWLGRQKLRRAVSSVSLATSPDALDRDGLAE
jgi:hypothetical protein